MKLAIFLLATTLTAAPLYTTQITLLEANGLDIGGFVSSPYTLQLGDTTVSAWCDDFLDQITLGQIWTANVYSGLALEGAYFPEADYQAMGWLVDQGNHNPLARIDIQQALWSIEDLDYVGTAASNSWLAEARREATAGHVNMELFRVVSGVVQSGRKAQEFIFQITPIPEPNTLQLVWIGLIVLIIGLIWGKKK